MLSVIQVAVASILLAFVAAAPTVQKLSAFTIHQTANPSHVKNGAAAYAKALAKYGAAPEKISAALKAPGSVIATAVKHDSEYLSPVTIGDQTFSLHFDTASSDLWVLGAEAGISGRIIYIPGSTARKLKGATWSITYGDDSTARGIVYRDTVNIGGVSVTGQAVEIATFASSPESVAISASDGLLGLAFSGLNTIAPIKQRTWFDSAVAQGLPALFAADLGANSPGFYDFGALNSAYSDSDITYTDVDNSNYHWRFTPDSFTVGSGSSYSIGSGFVDTGTSLLLLDDSVVSAYYIQVNNAEFDPIEAGWRFKCSTTLPDLTITINGYNAVIPGSYINYAPADTLGEYCYGGIQSQGAWGIAVYGDVFLKSQYVVFDQTTGSPRLGFAAKAERIE